MNLRSYVKSFLGRNPSLFYPVFSLLGGERLKEECMLNNNSEIVIEGFPRTANTFSVVAFRQAQGRDVRMAHHLHVECQIVAGVKKGLPVIALIRNPDEAVRSLLIREPSVSVEYAFKRYCEFYSAVKEVRYGVVMAPFQEITTDYASIINRVNEKFSTSYQVYCNSSENDKTVYEIIDAINFQLDGGKETHVARPSNKRDNVVIDTGSSIYRQRALELYKDLTGL